MTTAYRHPLRDVVDDDGRWRSLDLRGLHGAYHCRTEWWFRICGFGIGFRDHRAFAPYFSERYSGRDGVPRRVFIHWGPFCIVGFHPWNTARRRLRRR